jgi:hypothetical protein
MRIAVSPWDCRSPHSSFTIASREIFDLFDPFSNRKRNGNIRFEE